MLCLNLFQGWWWLWCLRGHHIREEEKDKHTCTSAKMMWRHLQPSIPALLTLFQSRQSIASCQTCQGCALEWRPETRNGSLAWICESVFCSVMLNVAVDWLAEWANWCSYMLLQYRASKSTIVNRATLKGYRLEVLRDWWMSVTLSSRFCNTSSPIGTYQWKKCCLNATDSACFL